MRVERRFTLEGKGPYAQVEFRKATSEIRNPDGSIVFQLKDIEVPGRLVPGRLRHHRAEIFPQGGHAGDRACRSRKTIVPEWLWRKAADDAAMAELPEGQARGRRDQRQAGVRPAGRHLDLLGLERRLFRSRRRRQGLLRRDASSCWPADGGAELSAMVQYRPALGLWHRRAGAGPPLCGLQDRRADPFRIGL